MRKNQDAVELFLEDIAMTNGDFHKIITTLRDHFLFYGPDLVEGIKYGGIVFSRGKELLGGIFPYRNHLSIDFSKGIELPDPHGILGGSGKFRRHIKLTKEKDIEANQVESFIKQVCELSLTN